MVCGSKEARQRLARIKWHSHNGHMEPIMFSGIVVCACSRHALGFKIFSLRSFVTKGLLRDYFTSRKGYCVTVSRRCKPKLLRDYFTRSRRTVAFKQVCFSFSFFVVIQPENLYLVSFSWFEVRPLGVYPLGLHSSSCGPTKVHHCPEPLYVPSEVNPLHVEELARIPGLTQVLYRSHPQPPYSVPRSPSSDRPELGLSMVVTPPHT